MSIWNTSDKVVEAVAYYVDRHMTWRDDAVNQVVFFINGWGSYSPGWDFPQPADLTLTISGNLSNASPTDDYQGDCEDHAILRAALLRSLGFAPWAIWDVLCESLAHEYNVVLYEGAYRIMDYGRIGSWLDTYTGSNHKSYYGWNEEFGPRNFSFMNHAYLVAGTNNFPGGKSCPVASASWNYLKYYKDHCK